MADPITRGEDVALFIDWENFKISLATGRRQPNVSALKEEVSNLGRVVVAKAYADWVTRAPELRGASQFINDPPALYAAGIEPVYVPTRLPWGTSTSSDPQRHTRVKNSVDVKMTADCIECAHSYPNINTFVLVSGDSDFIHVVNTLRTMGKHVVIIGVSWATSRRLADQVDGLILYDQDVDPVVPVVPVEPAPAPNGREPARNGGPDLAVVIREIEEIVRTERAAGGTPLLTSIKQRLMRRFPSFDEKQLGYSGFKKLMARVAQEGNIRLTTAGLVDWATMADEPPPSETQASVQSETQVEAQPEIQSEAPVELPEESQPPPARGRRRRIPAVRRVTAGEEPATELQPATEPEDSAEQPPVSQQSGEAEQPPVSQQSGESESGEEAEEATEVQAAQPISSALEAKLAETSASLNLPQGSNDEQDVRRIADLIVMADTLEHREGISHVAFNFLVGQVCEALEQGLQSDYAEITQRWSQVYSRGYVSKMFRGLSEGNLFHRGWHSWRDEVSGQNRRRRTFNLDRTHPVVNQVLNEHWKVAESDGDTATATQPVDGVRHWDADASEDPHALVDEYGDVNAEDDAEARAPAGFLSRLFHPRD